MGLFGLKTKKEVEQREKQARESLLHKQQNDLANLAKGSQITFSIQYFDVFDPRFDSFAVPVAVRGAMVYCINDISAFNRINKTQNNNDVVFEQKLRGQLTKYIKSVVTNVPSNNNIPVLQMERKLIEIGELVQRLVSPKIEELFGITVRSLDITEIEVDKESRGYRELKAITADIERDTLQTRSSLSLDSLRREHEMSLGGQEALQRMQLENQRETMRIQREEMQRAARLQTESNFLSAHQANLNADVAKTGSIFSQKHTSSTSLLSDMIPPIPGSIPPVQYMVGINGQQAGPFDWMQLQQLVQQGKLTQQTYVWKQGMPNWDFAGKISELLPLFLSI